MTWKSARAIRQQLADARSGDPACQIEWLESELDGATLAGFDAAQNHLKRVAAINESLATTWPKDPASVYRLACFVTQREPTLAPAVAEASR